MNLFKSVFNPDVFYPKFFTTIKGYTKHDFRKDAVAGAIVAIVSLPMAIAFGIASGVTPEQGIITAIVAGFIIAFLGGSRVQIGGPTGAFIIIIAGVVANYGMKGLIIATFLAGIIQIIMGFLKLGDVIKFMPYPVVVGFTSGIAVVIFSTQIKDFFGLTIVGDLPNEFHQKWVAYAQNFGSLNWYATGISFFTLLITILWSKVSKAIPGTLIAIVITTAAVYFLKIPVETIGSRFGEIQANLPAPKFPNIDLEAIRSLLPVAFTLAILGAIESLLSAMVADGAIGGRHRSNTELIAQGIANVVTPLFGGIPAIGAYARTMTNINNGGRTPVAGMIHSVVLLLILLVFGFMVKLIPMACLAGILVVVAYNMSEWRSFKGLFKNSKSEVAVLLVTFFLTMLFGLTTAIEVGLLLALFLFVRRVSKNSDIKILNEQEGNDSIFEETQIPKGVDVFRVNGPFFFGLANKFEEAYKQVQKSPKVRIIDLYQVPFMDASGLHNLDTFVQRCKSDKTKVLLSSVNETVMGNLTTDVVFAKIGKENIFTNFEDAVKRAEEIL